MVVATKRVELAFSNSDWVEKSKKTLRQLTAGAIFAWHSLLIIRENVNND